MNDLLIKYIEYDVLGVAIGCMKRFDENIKIQKLDLNGKDKVKSERREELFKKIRQQDRRNFQQS